MVPVSYVIQVENRLSVLEKQSEAVAANGREAAVKS
jgi:hypothetical protein